jgi:hypothetical protein
MRDLLHATAVAMALPATLLAAPAPEQAKPRTWGQRLADTTLAEHPTLWQMRKSDGEYRWSYTPGLVGLGLLRLHQKHPEPRYFDYVKAYVDHYVDADGKIGTFAAEEFNLDSLLSGRLLFPLLDDTGDPRYRKAIEELRVQLRWQPRTKGGVFWHKLKYPWQVWLDGVYMGEPSPWPGSGRRAISTTSSSSFGKAARDSWIRRPDCWSTAGTRAGSSAGLTPRRAARPASGPGRWAGTPWPWSTPGNSSPSRTRAEPS